MQFFRKRLLTFAYHYNIICLALSDKAKRKQLNTVNGVWLSLARAPGLGPGGRRFESCHPDL